MGFKAQHLSLHGPKYKAKIYSTWPKYKAQIILNNLYNLEDFSLMFRVHKSDLSKVAFGPKQLVESLNGPNLLESSLSSFWHFEAS